MNDYLAMGVGMILTLVVQSSSVASWIQEEAVSLASSISSSSNGSGGR